MKDDLVKYQGNELHVKNILQALIMGKYLALLLEKEIRLYADINGKLEEVCTYNSVE